MAKIDGIQQEAIESKNEQKWFSLIKGKAREVGHGELYLRFIIKNEKIVRVKNIVKETEYLVGE